MVGLLSYHFVHIKFGQKNDQVVLSHENACHTPSLKRHGVITPWKKIRHYLVPH